MYDLLLLHLISFRSLYLVLVSQLKCFLLVHGFEPFQIGIGINKGKAVSGNIGSEQQMNYTVIGDTINLGARLCSHAKSGQILISNSVKDHISEKHNFKKIPSIAVKGKAKPIEVWLYTHKRKSNS